MRTRSSLAAFAALGITSWACSTPIVTLRHPTTGQLARCGAESALPGSRAAYERQRDCIRDFQRQGYERVAHPDPLESYANVTFRPAPGSHFVYRGTQTVRMQPVGSPAQSQTVRSERRMDVLGVDRDAYDVRMTMAEHAIRMSLASDGTIRRLKFETLQTPPDAEERFRHLLNNLFASFRQNTQPWKIGERRPISGSFPVSESERLHASGSRRLVRIIVFNSRQAAEFEDEWSFGGKSSGAEPMRIQAVGREWIDADTGVMLKREQKATGESASPKAQIVVEDVEEVDFEQSRF